MKGSRRERQNEEGKIIKGKWTEIQRMREKYVIAAKP